jgi:hypothetical protein|nr:MAG TPA: hypothetical protein [Caudoviricetes sp.]
MLKIEKTETYGWEAAIRGMRNPMNSWAKSDSEQKYYGGDSYKGVFKIGDNDLNLMKRLRNAGTDHRKYLRMITVYCDITAPLYWWKEFDTYKVGTVVNSCSTMHKIQAKEFTLDDFSHERLNTRSTELLNKTIDGLNNYRDFYLTWDDCGINLKKMYEFSNRKDVWWQMIQLLPSSYNQKRTVMLNYEVLANMYKSRKNHKLDEWHTLCDWIKTLPYSELITGEEE